MQNWMSSLPLDVAVDLVKDAFVSAGERDIYTVSPQSSYMLVMESCQQSMHSLTGPRCSCISPHFHLCCPELLKLGAFIPSGCIPVMHGHTVRQAQCMASLQGDAVEIYVMTKEGTKKEVMPLKKD